MCLLLSDAFRLSVTTAKNIDDSHVSLLTVKEQRTAYPSKNVDDKSTHLHVNLIL
jgi:hypothetical protein